MACSFDKTFRWMFILFLTTLLASGCGKGRKKYLEQVTVIIEQNDAIDARVAQLPELDTFKDPDYLTKLDGYIASKQKLLNQLETIEPPLLVSTTHSKLIQAMKNGIRYLQSEREKFLLAAEKMSQIPAAPHERDEFEIIREYQSQTAAYQADIGEQLMKQQYWKLYDEVKEELERAKRF